MARRKTLTPMELNDQLGPAGRQRLADKLRADYGVETTAGYLYQIFTGRRNGSHRMMLAITEATGGKVDFLGRTK